ncbi:MAG: glycosyltransferase [Eubacteriales bacterium]|nr:glycosyltransferase [Eubacteriales bacterium]
MPKILLIADSDALWTKRAVEYLLLPAGYEIVIFPIWGHKGQFDDYYREHDVTVYRDPHRLPVIRHIPRVRMWARIALNARDLAKYGPFDVVHNHYLSQRDLSLGWRVSRRFHARWVCTFWGSDLLRASDRALRQMLPYLRRCDRLTACNERMRDKLRQSCGEELYQKTRMTIWGQDGFAAIDRVLSTETREDCRAHYGIRPGNYVVSIGYSADNAQHQLEVVEALSALPKENLSHMTLVLQQTYVKRDPAYMERVRQAAEALPCQVVVLRDFLDLTETAWLRLCADLFILAISTDAFAASMQEYLYAGAVFLMGDWLGYPQLDELGIPINRFHEYKELPALVQQAMNGKLQKATDEQRALLPAHYSWDAVHKDWLGLYE